MIHSRTKMITLPAVLVYLTKKALNEMPTSPPAENLLPNKINWFCLTESRLPVMTTRITPPISVAIMARLGWLPKKWMLASSRRSGIQKAPRPNNPISIPDTWAPTTPNRLYICPSGLALLIEGSPGLYDKRLISVKITRKNRMMPYISLRIGFYLRKFWSVTK